MFATSVLIMLPFVEAAVRRFTLPVVFNVLAVVAEAVGSVASVLLPRVKKSDLINPAVPFIVTLDHPAGLCSVTSTLAPALTVLTTLDSVEADSLTLTPPVVWKVAEVSPIWNLKKSDLIKPAEPPTVTLDQPAGLWSRTSTSVPESTALTNPLFVDGSDLRLTLPVVRNVPIVASAKCDTLIEPAITRTIKTMLINLNILRFTMRSPIKLSNIDTFRRCHFTIAAIFSQPILKHFCNYL